MKVEDGKIKEITENELYDLWLRRGMDDIMSFTEYMMRFESAGTNVIHNE